MMLNIDIFDIIIMLKILNERNCVLNIIINNNHLKRFIKTNLIQKISQLNEFFDYLYLIDIFDLINK